MFDLSKCVVESCRNQQPPTVCLFSQDNYQKHTAIAIRAIRSNMHKTRSSNGTTTGPSTEPKESKKSKKYQKVMLGGSHNKEIDGNRSYFHEVVLWCCHMMGHRGHLPLDSCACQGRSVCAITRLHWTGLSGTYLLGVQIGIQQE